MDVILKLLKKEPTERLGDKGGPKEIMEHPWFEKINFDELINKKVILLISRIYSNFENVLLRSFQRMISNKTLFIQQIQAPFVPALKNDTDVSYFDEEFISEGI